MGSLSRQKIIVGVSLALITATSCSRDSVGPGLPPAVSRVTILEYDPRMQIGEVQQLRVDVQGLESNAVFFGFRTDEVSERLDPLAGFITRFDKSTGTLRANSVGSVTVVARSQLYGEKFDTAVIHVDPPPAATRLQFARIASEDGRSCGITRDGDTYCWGANRNQSLGAGAISVCGNAYEPSYTPILNDCNPLPARVKDAPRFSDIQVGQRHTCGLSAGEVYCWGENVFGEVGVGRSARVTSPEAVAIEGRVISLSASPSRSCAVTESGETFCWGVVRGGVPLDPVSATGCFATGNCVSSPVRIEGLPPAKTVSVSLSHSCILDTDGQAHCWGSNGFGQLGNGTYAASNAPVRVVSDTRFGSVSAGFLTTCAITALAEAYCWGVTGVLHDDCVKMPVTCSSVPRALPTSLRFREVVARDKGACGLAMDEEVYCWGARSVFGELPFEDVINPERIKLPGPYSGLSGGQRSCAIHIEGYGFCWGRNVSGDTGTGQLRQLTRPTMIEGPLPGT